MSMIICTLQLALPTVRGENSFARGHQIYISQDSILCSLTSIMKINIMMRSLKNCFLNEVIFGEILG